MKKYMTVLLLAAIAGTAMAQPTFQPKHPGILARQMEQRQMKIEVAPVQKLTQAKPSAATTRATIWHDLQLDSVVVKTAGDVVKKAEYNEYHANGTKAKTVVMAPDWEGNLNEFTHTEWTEDYPLKGSSMTQFGYDTLGIYRAVYKMELHDDYGYSYLKYNGITGELKPVERVSTTFNEKKYVQSQTYYWYDENGKELPEDSIVYTYDEKDRLVRETYFLADKNGQLEEMGYFETTYTEVETPSGPGTLARLTDSDEIFRQDSIYSDDQKYQYFAYYTKENQTEWQIKEDRTSQDFDSTFLNLRFFYEDNAVKSGEKIEVETKYKEDDKGYETYYVAHEYSCGADTTQWLLLRKTEEDFYTYGTKYGREGSDHQTFIYEADEKGELQSVSSVMIVENCDWISEYTYFVSETYLGDEMRDVFTYYYYHDPNTTGISSIEAQAKDGVIYDLSGRRLSNDQRGAFMIKNGRVVVVK